MATYRLFSQTDGPVSPVSYGGSFLAGVLFQVTAGGVWFDGYWWWVCNTGQSTAAQQFALWAVYAGGTGSVIPAATVKSDTLTAGQWNYVPLAAPIPLSMGACYNACTGFTGSFPATDNQFGSGDPYASGIVSGPLSAFSDLTGTAPAPFSMTQGVFGTASTDPTVNMPVSGFDSANFWMDLQVTDTAPAGASYRLWPSYPTIPPTTNEDDLEQTFGTEFGLSEPCEVNNIWFYSPPDVSPAALPTTCAIWDVQTQQVVSGTQNDSPSWSGAAGSGWVACPYSGVTLPAGDYKVTVFTSGGSDNFYQETEEYWGTGAGANGIVSGPLTAPSTSHATAPGQTTYHHGSFAYPDTYDTDFNGQNRWVDVEVTPSTSSSGPSPTTSTSTSAAPTADSTAFLTFFP
jgi:hypothetical protein